MDRLIYDFMRSAGFFDRSTARQEEIEYSSGIIAEIFGRSPLKSITPDDVDRFYSACRRKYSEHKSARLMKDLRFLFNRALKLRLIYYNPALAVTVKAPAPRKVYWEHEQVEKAICTGLEIGFDGAAIALAVAYDTGLSPADIRALTVGDVADGAWTGRRIKTGEGFNVELWPETLAMVKAYHKKLGVIPMKDALLVRTRRGKPFTKDRLGRDVRHILRNAGIPNIIQMRDLRRTVATEMVESGVTDAEIEAAMGVSSRTSGVWRKTYAPASETMARNARTKRNTNRKGAS
jgi:integrase